MSKRGAGPEQDVLAGAQPLRGPVAFALDGEHADQPSKTTILEEVDFTQVPDTQASLAPQPRRNWLAMVFWSAFGVLVSLYVFDAAWSLVLSLEAKHPVIGQIALGLLVLVALGLLIFVLREIFAVLRMRKIDHLRDAVIAARSTSDPKAALDVIADLMAFYARDPATSAARSALAQARGEIHDAATLLDMTERALFAGKDNEARQLIATAAQRVSMFTALSPRALVDILFVLAQSLMLIRQLSALYGGRASGIGLIRLMRRVGTHLMVTGGMAAADSLLGQVMGAGLASRLSAKLGEGVLNGVLTARVGIAALAACRPMMFDANQPVILSQVVKNIITQSKVAENPAA